MSSTVVRLSWSSSMRMAFAADYGGMPDTLLRQIFSCCNLTFRSKYHANNLKQLDLSEMYPEVEIPRQIANLASWPQLTVMDFSTAGIGGEDGIKSYRSLIVLAAALHTRRSDLKFGRCIVTVGCVRSRRQRTFHVSRVCLQNSM